MANPKIVIDVETHLGDVNKVAKQYEEHLKNMQKEADKTDLSGNISKQIQGAIDDLKELRDDYSKAVKDLANEKISTDAFDKFAKELDSRMDQISERINDAEEAVNSLQQSMKDLNVDKLQSQLDKTKRSFRDFKGDVKEAVEALKEFQNIINMKANDRQLAELDKTIRKLENLNVTKKASGNISGNIQKLKDDFADTYEIFIKLQNGLDKAKDPGAIKNYQKQIVDTAEKLTSLGQKIAALTDGKSMAESGTVFKRNNKDYSLTWVATEIEDLQEASSKIKQSLANSRKEIVDSMEALGETANATVASFTFEDGGIQIPVVLNKESMQKCRSDLDDLVTSLKSEFEDKPVDVFIRLFPLKTNKKDLGEVSKYVNDIRAQIPNEASDELKDKLNKFVDNFAEEYQKALELNIKVNLSDTPEGVKEKIDAIQKEVKKQHIIVEPEFKIDPNEAENLDEQFKKVRSNFSFDLTGQLNELANSINKMLSDNSADAWSENFKNNLNRLKPEVEELSKLVSPLLELTSNKNKNKRGRPSKEDLANRNYIQQFTSAIDALSKALNIYDKEIRYSEDIGKKLISSVQNSINASDDYVLIPIEPDVDGFIEKIENALQNIKINLGNVSIGSVVGGDKNNTPITIVTSGNTSVEGNTTNVESNTNKSSKKSTPTKVQPQKNKWASKETDGMDSEFANVYFGKGKRKRGTKEEKDAINEINSLINNYRKYIKEADKIQKKIEHMNPNSDEELELLNEYNTSYEEAINKVTELEKQNPILKKVRNTSRLSQSERDSIINEYLSSKGIERTKNYTAMSYFQSLQDEVAAKGEFKLNNKQNKKDLTSIVQRYIGYKNRIGEDKALGLNKLSDDPNVVKKLEKEYNKLLGIKQETKKVSDDVASTSENLTHRSEYEGVTVDKLQEKYDRLTDKKDEYIKASEHQQVADSLTVGAEDEVEAAFRKLKAIQKIQNVMDAYAAFEGAHGGIKGEYVPENAGDFLTYQQSLRKELNEFKEQYGVNKSSLKGIEKFTDEELHNIAVQAAAKYIASEGIDKEINKLDYEMKYREQQKLEAEEKEREAEKKKENQENIKKAKKAVADRKKAAQENKKEKAEDKTPQSNIKQETQQIENQNKILEENTKKQKKNQETKKTTSSTTDSISKKLNEQLELEKSFNSIRDKILKEKTNFDLRTANGKENLSVLADWYNRYKTAGGARNISDLTNDVSLQNKLNKILQENIKEQKDNQKVKEKKQNTSSEIQENINNIKEESAAIEENTQKQRENNKTKLEEFQASVQRGEIEKKQRAEDFIKSNPKYKKLSTDYVAYSENIDKEYDIEQLNGMLKKRSEFVKIKNQAFKLLKSKDISGFTDEDLSKLGEYDSQMAHLLKEMGSHVVDAKEIYSEYNKVLEQWADKYEKFQDQQKQSQNSSLKDDKLNVLKNTEDIKKESEATEELIKKHKELKTQMEEAQNRLMKGDQSAFPEITSISNQIMDIRNRLQSEGFVWDNLNSSFKKVGENQAESLVEGAESQIPKVKQTGEELGNALNEGAADATQTHSPSRVAEELGEMWGIGYAQGVRKHKGEVEEAVRELVGSGKITAEELQKDLDTLLSGGFGKKYKALKEPLQNILGDRTETKNQISNIIKELNNKDIISLNHFDDINERFNQSLSKWETLGGDVTEFQNKFDAARAKVFIDNGYGDLLKSLDKKELVKHQDKLLSSILSNEKDIGVANFEGNTSYAKYLSEQNEVNQRYYDAISNRLKTLGEEDILQQQAIKETEKRRQQEEQINQIIAKRTSDLEKKEQKFYEDLAKDEQKRQSKDRERINQEVQKSIDNVKKNNLQLSDQELAQITNVNAGVWKENGYYDYKKYTEGDKWIGALSGADNLLDKYDELLKAEKELDKVSKDFEKAPETYAKSFQEAKDVVSSLHGEIRDLLESTSLDSLSEEQNQRWIETDKALEKIYNNRKANEEIIAQKQAEAAEKQIQNAEKIRQAELKTLMEKYDKMDEKRTAKFESLRNKLGSAGYDVDFEIKNGNPTEEFELRLQNILQDIIAINSKPINAITDDDIAQAENLLEEIRQIRKEGKLAENRRANENSLQKGLAQINSLLSENTKGAFKRTDVYKDLVNLQDAFRNFDTSRPQSELAELTTELLRVKARFEDLDNTIKGKNLFQTFVERLHGTTAQLIAQYLSFQDIIRYARETFNVVQELNIQMVELAKVSEQSLSQIEGDFNSYTNIAKELGATISDTISATADWARMGYNVPDAKQLAEVALLYKNVGDGIDITAANQSLISTLQGYQMQADEAEHIVDVFNEVANNYAIDTAGIGEALQRSAASLNAANTSLEQSVALVTAANTVVQNPESVGTTFKTNFYVFMYSNMHIEYI